MSCTCSGRAVDEHLAKASRTRWNERESRTCNDGGDACPDGNVDRPLLLDTEIEAANRDLMRRLRIRESAVNQGRDSGDDEKDCGNFESAHDVMLLLPRVATRTTNNRR